MIRFLAVIKDGRGEVINVADSELRKIVAHEQAAGSVVIGDYAEKHIADRAVQQYLAGWRRPEEGESA